MVEIRAAAVHREIISTRIIRIDIFIIKETINIILIDITKDQDRDLMREVTIGLKIKETINMPIILYQKNKKNILNIIVNKMTIISHCASNIHAKIIIKTHKFITKKNLIHL